MVAVRQHSKEAADICIRGKHSKGLTGKKIMTIFMPD
jgi:hypothetical protein